MQAKVTIRKHAVHPMLVTLPLGALPTALVFDAIHVFTGAEAWFLAALVATLVGVVGIVLAAIPGFIDYASVVPEQGEVQKRAYRHMALGVTLLILFSAIAVFRWMALPQATGLWMWGIVALHLLGMGGLAVQGYWGAELVERHGIGVYSSEAAPQPSRRRDVRGGRF